MKTKKTYLLISLIIGILIINFLNYYAGNKSKLTSYPIFDKERAYADVVYQVSLGPRYPGSQAHEQTIQWIHESLEAAGWEVEIQTIVTENIEIQNIIAKLGNGKPDVILGAHYDTRILADNDPEILNRSEPVLGANDGASGVAVLLELSRSLQSDSKKNVWLVFFDYEDNGGINGLSWAMGSKAFVDLLDDYPKAVIIVDMIGDKNLDIFIEKNSNQELVNEIWKIANDLGYGQFINQPKYQMIDDHVAFLAEGIVAIDIIDFDYPYWHTTEDTLDKISPDSLFVVGNTLLQWLISR